MNILIWREKGNSNYFNKKFFLKLEKLTKEKVLKIF